MKSALYVSTQSSGFSSSNPMAVQMRQALAKQYGFVASDDPFEFSRQIVEAKAKVIAAEIKAKDKLRKTETENTARAAKQAIITAHKEPQAWEADKKEQIQRGWLTSRIINTSKNIPLVSHKHDTETVVEKMKRLKEVVQQAEECEMRRQYGRWGRASKEKPEAPRSPWTELRQAHLVNTVKTSNETAERDQIINELQELDAFRGEFMFNYSVFDLRKELMRAKKLHRVVVHQAEQAPASNVTFEGYLIGEDERERVIFTTRRVRGQLPKNTDKTPIVELLTNLKAQCERKGLKWFAELWPNATQVLCPVAPQGLRLEISAPKEVVWPIVDSIEPTVERLWTAIFGSLGTGN